MVDVDSSTREDSRRFVSAWRLFRALVAYKRRTFFFAVAGAASFALCTVASSFGIRWLVDHVILPRFTRHDVSSATFFTGLGIVFLIAVLRAVSVVVRRSLAGVTQWGVAEVITNQVTRQMALQPPVWHAQRGGGDLIARCGVDVEAAVGILAPLPYASSVLVLIAASTAGLFYMDMWFGVTATVMFPLLVAMNVVYQSRVERHFATAQDALGDLSEAALESFEAVTVVKSFGAEERETRRLASITERLRDARLRVVRQRATFEATLDGVPGLVNMLLLAIGAWRVHGGHMTVGDVTSAIYLFTLLVFPLRFIGFVFAELPHAQAGWVRVREVLDEAVVRDPWDDVKAADTGSGVVLRHVSVGYGDADPVLRDVNLEIPRGGVTAIVGATGCGKSTLLRAIAGLQPLRGGDVYVQQRRVALVFQEAFLFSGTLRYNLTLGRDIADRDIDDALAVADAEFLRDIDGSLDAQVGERGVSLSGGQRQRLALARALLLRRDVLLLDDTTSALDPETELRVLEHLQQRADGMTIIAVASRPTTIATSDRVVFLADGGVADMGPHEQLMERCAAYAELMEAFAEDRTTRE